MAAGDGERVRPGGLLLTALAAVSWSFLAMVGVAALALHLMGADEAGALGPMTAAAVALAVGGAVDPSGDVSVFGLVGADATSAVDVTPLGISLVGALLLGYLFLRSLRGAGPVIGLGELAARAGAVAVLFVALLGGLCWVGNDTVTIDGSELGLGDIGRDRGEGLLDRLPEELGDIAGIGGGLLPGHLADLVNAKAEVGFSVAVGRSLLGGLVWVLGVLLIALLVARRAPLPEGWDGAHETVRPAASALCAVLVLAVGAGLAAAAVAAIDDDHPGLVIGGALLGAPNGAWLGVPLGLFVPWHGSATGPLRQVLPDPLDDLLGGENDKTITVGRLAELNSEVWLLVVACVLAMLAAGLLTAARTPLPGSVRGDLQPPAVTPGVRDPGPYRFAGRCAVRLSAVTALTFPLLVWLTGLSAGAGLSILGFDAFDSRLELHGSVLWALLLGAVWGGAAGFVGALLTWTTGTAGFRALGPGAVGGGRG